MQQYPLVPVADTEQRCDLVGAHLFDVPQGHDLSLCVRQLREERVNASGELLGDEVIVDPIRPRHRRGRPVATCVEAFLEILLRNAGSLFATRSCSARLRSTWNSHVLNDERPSKRSTPRKTVSQVSWVISSATARLPTVACARRRSRGW